MWKLRWLSWAPIPNKPMVSVDVKQHSTNQDKEPLAYPASHYSAFCDDDLSELIKPIDPQRSNQSAAICNTKLSPV